MQKKSSPEWNKIKKDFLNGVPRRDICEKYGLSYATLNRKIHIEEWVKSKEKIIRKTIEKTEEKIIESLSDKQAKYTIEQEKKFALLVAKTLEALEQDPCIENYKTASDILDKSYKNIRQALGMRDIPQDVNLSIHKKKTPAEIEKEMVKSLMEELNQFEEQQREST